MIVKKPLRRMKTKQDAGNEFCYKKKLEKLND